MFAALDGTVDQALERRREARRRELGEIREREARDKQRITEIVREADDDGDWQAAGCSSSAAWFAQLYYSDYRTAQRITSTSVALRGLPALDHALGTGALTLDQVAAATQFATPASDAQLARIAVGKAPSAIALAARTIVPPKVERRPGALRAALFEHVLGARRARACVQWAFAARAGRRLRAGDPDHRQAAARTRQERRHDARVAAVRRRRACRARPPRRRRQQRAAQPHHPDRPPQPGHAAAPRRRRTDQRRDRRAAHLRRPPAHHQAPGPRSRALARHTLRLLPPAARAVQALRALPIPRLHRRPRTRSPPPHPVEHGGRTDLDNLILLCPRHHKLLHDHHIHTSGNGEHPVFADADGRAITTNQPHAPPR